MVKQTMLISKSNSIAIALVVLSIALVAGGAYMLAKPGATIVDVVACNKDRGRYDCVLLVRVGKEHDLMPIHRLLRKPTVGQKLPSVTFDKNGILVIDKNASRIGGGLIGLGVMAALLASQFKKSKEVTALTNPTLFSSIQ